jgi:hypothetical protein
MFTGQFVRNQLIQFGDGQFSPFIVSGDSSITHVGAFNTGTGAAASTVAVTGVGFQPKAVIFWWSGQDGTADVFTDTPGATAHGMGFATSSSERGAVANCSLDAVGTSDVARIAKNDACVTIYLTSATTIDGSLDFQSMDSDGFTLVVDDAFATSRRVHYMAIGGSDITNAKAGSFTVAASTGNQDFNIGFTPDLVLMLNAQTEFSSGSVATDAAIFSFGALTAAEQFCYLGWSKDNSGTSDTTSYMRMTDDAWAVWDTLANGNTPYIAAGSIITDGFRLNVANAFASAVDCVYLAFKGGNYRVGEVLTRTNTTAWAETGFGFAPTGAMFISAMRAEDAVDSETVHNQLSIGGASSGSARQVAYIRDENVSGTMDVAVGYDADFVYANSLPTSLATSGEMDLNSFDADGMTLQMDEADASAKLVAYIAFG